MNRRWSPPPHKLPMPYMSLLCCARRRVPSMKPALSERALATRTHLLGAAHPLTLETRACLEALSGGVERAEEAALPEQVHLFSLSDLPSEVALANASRVSSEQSPTLTSASERVLVVCPQCHQAAEVLKSGKNRAGSQRF